MGQRSIRFPDDLEARLVAAAKADGRTFSNFVVRALESALGSVIPADTPGPAASRDRGEGVPNARSSAPSRASAKKVEVALEARDAVQKRNAEKAAASGELPKIAKRHWA